MSAPVSGVAWFLGSLSIAFILIATAVVVPAGASEPQPDKPVDLNYAQVQLVELARGDDGIWCVHVTVRHNDQGWDHYADAWEVVDVEGERIAIRWLAHPHDDEQPFRRSKCGIKIPKGLKALVVRARCKVHGFGGREVTVDMALPEGEGFKFLGR